MLPWSNWMLFGRFAWRSMSSTSSNMAQQMAERIKALEAAWSSSLPAGQPFVVRLDGVAFKGLTAGMAKPFDPRFTQAMMLTARDLMDRSAARLGFCQSDEITLVFGPEVNVLNIMYSGRTIKIASVLASIAAARFNHHLGAFGEGDWAKDPKAVDCETWRKASSGNAFFDARVFAVPDDKTAMESVYWRHKYDCRRNVVNSVGFHLLGHQEMTNVPLTQVLSQLQERRHGLDPFEAYPKPAMWGAFLKRIQFEHLGFNPVTGESVPALRTRIEARTFDWAGDEESRIAMTMARFWEPSHPASADMISL